MCRLRKVPPSQLAQNPSYMLLSTQLFVNFSQDILLFLTYISSDNPEGNSITLFITNANGDSCYSITWTRLEWLGI